MVSYSPLIILTVSRCPLKSRQFSHYFSQSCHRAPWQGEAYGTPHTVCRSLTLWLSEDSSQILNFLKLVIIPLLQPNLLLPVYSHNPMPHPTCPIHDFGSAKNSINIIANLFITINVECIWNKSAWSKSVKKQKSSHCPTSPAQGHHLFAWDWGGLPGCEAFSTKTGTVAGKVGPLTTFIQFPIPCSLEALSLSTTYL